MTTPSTSHVRNEGFGVTLVAPLVLGSLLNPINSSMIATALAPIGRAFHVGVSETVWLVASLYVTSAVAQPTMGKLADRWGARRVFLLGLAFVLLGGIVGALASSLAVLISVRILLGIGTSAAYPSAMRVLRTHAQRLGRETPRPVLGVLSLAALSSAAVGPTLGGFLTGVAGWRSIFFVNVPLAIAGIVLCLLFVEADEKRAPARDGAAIDWLGLLLFTGAIVAAMVFAMSVKTSPRFWLVPIALLLIVALVLHSRRPGLTEPFLDLRSLAANKALSATYLRFAVTCLLTYVVFYGFAQWMQDALGYSATEAGIATLPLSISAAVASLLGARTTSIRAPLAFSAFGLLVGCGGLLVLGDHSSRWALGAVGIVFGVAQGASAVANQAAVYEQAPAAQIGTASGLQRTAGYLGAVGASSLLGFFYGARATSAGLHALAVTMVVLSALLCAGTLLDPALATAKKSKPSN
ncbi:Permease of the major facilitator superfamily [Labilithrix luteola]|uniref:Permease of the major facilitator superfamily n=1 Tax=Labilithrix luteola TaxID=1391654 RepID=A0A0K1Q3P2_9BACT|nr:MFS transporter [Labilithrix luteola]AKV00368.1 Permease of the major facilitator superfamily [Labilithrix luteola]